MLATSGCIVVGARDMWDLITGHASVKRFMPPAPRLNPACRLIPFFQIEQVDRLVRTQNRYQRSHSSMDKVPAILKAQDTQPSFSHHNSGTSMDTDSLVTPEHLRTGPDYQNSHLSSDQQSTRRFRQPTTINPDAIPTKVQSDGLLNAFLESYQAVSPLVHVPSFMRSYTGFWEAQAGELLPHVDSACISLLYATWLAGSVVITNANLVNIYPGRIRSVIAKDLYARVKQWLDRASYMRVPAIDSFTAFLISESIWLRGEGAINLGETKMLTAARRGAIDPLVSAMVLHHV